MISVHADLKFDEEWPLPCMYVYRRTSSQYDSNEVQSLHFPAEFKHWRSDASVTSTRPEASLLISRIVLLVLLGKQPSATYLKVPE